MWKLLLRFGTVHLVALTTMQLLLLAMLSARKVWMCLLRVWYLLLFTNRNIGMLGLSSLSALRKKLREATRWTCPYRTLLSRYTEHRTALFYSVFELTNTAQLVSVHPSVSLLVCGLKCPWTLSTLP